MKEFARKTFPRFFVFARGIKDQIKIEWQMLRQVGLRIVVERILPRNNPWQDTLPLQAPRAFAIPHLAASSPEELVNFLQSIGIEFAQGGHTIYLSPAALASSPFQVLCQNYPSDAALKIVRNPGGIEGSEYVYGHGHSAIQRKITHSHRHLSLVANVLHAEGLGPRLYDLVELGFGSQTWAAYIVEHCIGRNPTPSEWEEGIEKLRQLEQRRVLKVAAPEGFNHKDFQYPTCNGNCLMDARTGKFVYIDFQNFVLMDHSEYLNALALEAADATHFGDRSVLRGGRYLYQSVPSLGVPAKRSVETRIPVLSEMMARTKMDLRGRLVLDFGCNLGMMTGQYLKLGAQWVHGWDMDYVTPHTQRLLWALGCTRFSLTPGVIHPDQPVESDVPIFLQPLLEGCVISYLAVRGHIGWLQALGRIPWAFMIYEGHERDSKDDFNAFISELGKLVPVRVAALATYRDGDSRDRPIAILLREIRTSG